MKTFLFEYFFNDGVYSIQIQADSPQEAKERLQRAALAENCVGELVFSVTFPRWIPFGLQKSLAILLQKIVNWKYKNK